MTRKQKTKAKALTISVHGGGIDIEARIGNARLSKVLSDMLSRVTSVSAATPVTATKMPAASDHDFDVVARVIQHADAIVLQAIVDLAKNELEQRHNAS